MGARARERARDTYVTVIYIVLHRCYSILLYFTLPYSIFIEITIFCGTFKTKPRTHTFLYVYVLFFENPGVPSAVLEFILID